MNANTLNSEMEFVIEYASIKGVVVGHMKATSGEFTPFKHGYTPLFLSGSYVLGENSSVINLFCYMSPGRNINYVAQNTSSIMDDLTVEVGAAVVYRKNT